MNTNGPVLRTRNHIFKKFGIRYHIVFDNILGSVPNDTGTSKTLPKILGTNQFGTPHTPLNERLQETNYNIKSNEIIKQPSFDIINQY